MKKILNILLIALLLCNVSRAQAPGEFNYQTVVRDNNGDLIVNQNIDIKISIIDETTDGAVLFTETHTKTTNSFGMVNLKIGSIETVSLTAIDWSVYDKYLKVEVDAGSGLIDMGTVQLLSVPYALYANNTDSARVAGMAYIANVAEVLGSDGVYSTSSDTLFVVKDHSGNVVFAVFPDGAQIIVNEAVKGKVGGFAVSGRSPSKAGDVDILRITADSTRIYVSDTVNVKGKVGGFAVSGRSPSKSSSTDILFVTADSTRIYVNEPVGKGKVGGFAVSGRSPSKGIVSSLMNLTKDNYFIGHESGISISNGLYNSFFGYQSGMGNFSGNRNIFTGYQSGFSNISGSDNTFVGNQSGMYQQTGNDNIYIGNESGENVINGTRNIYIGKQAGFNANSSLNTVAVGYQSGYSNTADNNTFIGPFSGMSNTTGRENLYIGHTAGQLIESGTWNVIVGAWAGHYGSKGNNNVIIGSYAGNVIADSLSGNVLIGSFVGRSNISSNRLFIDNKNTNFPLIYGEFDNTLLRFNGEVGIGRTPVTNDLEVNGTASKTTAGDWLANSDKRIKTEITDIENAKEIMMKLHPVMFKYTEEWRIRNPEIKDQFYYNFIAQEYQEIFPESVNGSGEYIDGDSNEILQLDSYNAQIVTITAVQDLIKDNKEQQNQIEELKAENELLKQKLNEIIELLESK